MAFILNWRAPRAVAWRTLQGAVVAALACAAAVAADQDQEVTYLARGGDTLIGLEQRLLAAPHGWKALKLRNKIADPLRIRAGTPLRIPESWLRDEPRTARVAAVSGDVSIDGRALAVDDRVSAGAVLRTGAGAFVTLVMPDESRLMVQPDSSAQLEKLQGFSGLPGQTTQILLERGRIETTVSPQKGPAARYHIRTPTATIAVRGTAFRVGAEAGTQIARAEVTGGTVNISSEQGGSALPAGFGVVARPGEAIPPPRRLLPAPGLAEFAAPFERIAPHIPFAAVDGAHAYRAQIAHDPAFADLVADSVVAAPPAVFGELPDGRYWLRVRAITADGLEGLDVTRAIALHAHPAAPQTAAPPERVDQRRVAFAWQPAAGAAAYALEVLPEGAAAPIERRIDGTSTELELAAGDYRWRIASLRESGERGPWSEAHLLMVVSPLGRPQLTDYRSSLRFFWSAPPGQIFDFELARDAAFTEPVLTRRSGEPAVTIAAPATGRYYLRVRATDADGRVGPFTPVQTLISARWMPALLLPAGP